jgi:hypothetical protein
MIEEKRFVGGMDFDSSPSYIEDSDYRNAINCDIINPRKGDLGRVKPVDGMTKVNNTIVDKFKHKVIGSIESLYHNAIIYCVADTIGTDHMIVRYNQNGTFDKIISGSFLNLSVDHPVRDMNIIEDFLLINDSYNPPRCFDIELSRRKTNNEAGDKYSVLNAETIEMIRPQPVKVPNIIPERNESLIDDGINNLGLRSYKFKYHYVFEDGREGSASVCVNTAITKQRLHSFVNTLPRRLWDNVIKVDFDITASNVKEIVFSVKRDLDSKYSEFKRVDVHDPNGVFNNQGNEVSGSLYNITTFKPLHVRFTNTEVLHALKPYNDRMFDDVPYIAGTQEVTSDNRVVYGDYETGYDPIDAFMSSKTNLTRINNDFGASGFIACSPVPPSEGRGRLYFDYYTLINNKGSNIESSSIQAYFDATLYADNAEFDGFSFKIIGEWPDFDLRDGQRDLRQKFADLGEGDLSTIPNVGPVSIWKIPPGSNYTKPPTENPSSDWRPCRVDDVRSLGSDYIGWRIHDEFGSTPNFVGASGGLYIYSTSDYSTVSGLKSNSEWSVGIVYVDEKGRINSVSKGENTTIKTGVNTRDDQVYHSDVEIFHRPPDWAVKYRLVATRNKLMNRYWQMPVMEVFSPNQLKTTSFAINDSDVLLKIPLGTEDKDLSDKFSDIYGYSNGDRFRVLDGSSTDTFEVRGLIQNAFKTGETDEIPGKFLIVDASNGYNFNDLSGKMIEIYQPILDTDKEELYYEILDGDIINAGLSTRRHAGVGSTNQGTIFNSDDISSVPAICKIERIDSWRIMKRFPYFEVGDQQVLYPKEDNTVNYAPGGYKVVEVPNLIGDMKDDSKFGRANAVLDDYGRTRKGSSVTYSERYILNTDIRNVNIFIQDVNFEEYKVEKGDIKKLKLFNDMMYIFQEDEINAVHMGKNMIFNADGSGSLSASSLIFSKPIHVSNLGLQDGTVDAVVCSKNILYFYDSKEKTLAGITGTTAEPIKAKMESFLANSPEITGSTKLVFGFDIAKGELLISYNGNGKEESLVFSELLGRFTKTYQHYSTKYINFNKEFYGFKDAELWKHNDNPSIPNEFYGQPRKDSTIEFWFNKQEVKEKIPVSIKINGDESFPIEIYGENGEQQKTIVEHWDRQGRSWFGYVPMNMLTPNMTTDQAIVNGEPIRDRNLKVIVTWDGSTPTFSLESLEMAYRLSHTAFN